MSILRTLFCRIGDEPSYILIGIGVKNERFVALHFSPVFAVFGLFASVVLKKLLSDVIFSS